MTVDEFGAFLKERRLALGMTIKDVADIYGCTPTYISAFEHGLHPSQQTAKRLLGGLGVKYKVISILTLELEDGQQIRFGSSHRGHKGLAPMTGLVFAIEDAAPGRMEGRIGTYIVGRFDNYRLMCNVGEYTYDGHDGMLSEDAWRAKIRAAAKKINLEEI